MAYVESRAWMTTRWPVYSGGTVISYEGMHKVEFYCRVLTGTWNSNVRPEFKVLVPYNTFEEAQRILIKHGRDRTRRLCCVPIIQSAVLLAVGIIVVVTPRIASLIIQILRHPCLPAYLHCPIFLTVPRIGEINSILLLVLLHIVFPHPHNKVSLKESFVNSY